MMTEQEALVPMLLAELRDSLMARVGAHTIKATGGEIVVTCDEKTVSVDIPHIDNVFLTRDRVASEIENLLTSGG